MLILIALLLLASVVMIPWRAARVSVRCLAT